MSIIEKLGITPGPWGHSDGYGKVYAKRIGGVGMTKQIMTVCDIRGWGVLSYNGEEKATAEQRSNETLISAAPDMLEALIRTAFILETSEAINDVIWFEDDSPVHETLWERCVNIIEKATDKTWEEVKELIE